MTIQIPDSDEFYPSWSDDGTEIVFQSDKYGNWDLFMYDVEKDSVLRLTSDATDEQHPVFIPGKNHLIAFDQRTGDTYKLKVLNLKENSTHDLITTRYVNGMEPSFPPSAKLVTFKGFDKTTNQYQVCSYDFIYDNLNVLTHSKNERIFSPEFSPDGKTIVYGAKEKKYPYLEKLKLITWYGDTLNTIDSLDAGNFCWSSSCYRIIGFKYSPAGSKTLVSIRKDGSVPVVLNDNGILKSTPSVSPVNNKIVLSEKINNDYDLVIFKITE